MRSSVLGASEAPKYPHGLRLTLEPEHANKLGLADAKVGSKVTIMAVAEVVSVSKGDSPRGDVEDKCVCLQITGMDVKQDKEKETVESLYGV